MGDLKGLRTYLIGPIEFIDNRGATEWRKKASDIFKSMGVIVYDPTNKPNGISSEIEEERRKITELKNQGNWKEFRKQMKEIVHGDLRAVDRADFLIAYMPNDVPMWGTVHEAVIARNQKKPVFVFTGNKKEKSNSWATYIIGENYIFETLDEIVEIIKNKSLKDFCPWS